MRWPLAGLEPVSGRDTIRTREVRWSLLALFIAVDAATMLLLLRFRRGGPLGGLLDGQEWRENLFFFAALLLVAVGGVLFGIARLRPADVGIRREKLAEGLLVIGAVWLLIQVLAAATALATTPTSADPTWTTRGVQGTLVWAAVMFLGAALYEEVVYRGFLYPQLFLKLRGSHRRRLWTALLVSQFLFAISHIPAHIVIRQLSGPALWSQVALQGFAGAMLLLLYLRTRNLWIPIGIHGLANAPTPLFANAMGWEYFLVGLLVVWPWLTRRPAQRGLAVVERDDDAGGARVPLPQATSRPAAVSLPVHGG